MALAFVWSVPALASPKSDAIQRLIQDGRIDIAQQKCDRMGAHLTDAGSALREVCAEALFEAALEENTTTGWIRFQQTWNGTSYAVAARDNEAAAALRALGNDSEEHAYAQFMIQYADTKYAVAAEQLVADAAIRGVKNGQDAVRVAQIYPNHRNTPILVEQYLASFIKMEVSGTDITVTLDPPISLPGVKPSGRWAASFGQEAYVDWGDVAEVHLQDLGISPNFIEKARAKGYPPCQVPEAGWELGIVVQVGQAKTFFKNTGVPECRRPWPGFMTYRGGRLSSLSVSPELTMHFPDDPTVGAFSWGPEADNTRMWAPGVAGDPILVGSVIGQPIGNLFLLHPLAGGMPWFVSQGPPPNAMPLPISAKTSAMPIGWSMSGPEGEMSPGQTAAGPVHVHSNQLGSSRWTLPDGEVRVMSPLVQQLTGLNRESENFGRARKSRLPLLSGLAGPMGASPVQMMELTAPNAAAVGRQLGAAGIPIKVTRAWEGFLSSGGPREVVFEGDTNGTPIKGILDATKGNSGSRIYVWLRDDRCQGEAETTFAFTMGGSTYFVWRGSGPNGDYNEAVHFEEAGLIREFR